MSTTLVRSGLARVRADLSGPLLSANAAAAQALRGGEANSRLFFTGYCRRPRLRDAANDAADPGSVRSRDRTADWKGGSED
jgi:hypothetical protein